jgi:hypothetical protein
MNYCFFYIQIKAQLRIMYRNNDYRFVRYIVYMLLESLCFILILLFIWTIKSKQVIHADGHIEDPIKSHVLNITNMVFEYVYLLIDFIKKIGITILSI